LIEAFSNWFLIGLASASLVVTLWWFVNSDQSPLWRRIARRPRQIRSASLAEKFNGLAKFGLDGASLSLTAVDSGDELSFVKRLNKRGFSYEVVVRATTVSAGLGEEISDSLIPFGTRRFFVQIGPGRENAAGLKLKLSGEGLGDPHALEGVASCILRCLGHNEDAEYRISFEGPTDRHAVAEYFGLKE
jgi:hypothetical protein